MISSSSSSMIIIMVIIIMSLDWYHSLLYDNAYYTFVIVVYSSIELELLLLL